MPATATAAKIEATIRAGAEVLVVEPDAIIACVHELEAERDPEFIRPFDDPHVIAGQGTVGSSCLISSANSRALPAQATHVRSKSCS